MVTTFTSKQLRFGGIALCLLLQISCQTSRSDRVGRYVEVTCAPAEVISKARQKLSDSSIGTTDPTTEGKGLAISTDYIVEREGNRERIGKYMLVVRPMENANKSTLTLQRLEGKSRGIRERVWYDDDATVREPQSTQQIWQQLKTICPAQ